jgi:hypothetical protein
MAIMGAVLRAVPCRRILLGPDLKEASDVIAAFIEEEAK